MRKFLLAAAICATAFVCSAPFAGARSHGTCHTARCRAHAAALCKSHPACTARVEARYARQRVAREASYGGNAFAHCVAMRESTMRRVTPGPYHSYFQWLISTWLSAGGGRYASVPEGATYAEQAAVFLAYEPTHRSAWPLTVPACGG